jgi:4-hydroxy-tetrahydrodipicolinate synthase
VYRKYHDAEFSEVQSLMLKGSIVALVTPMSDDFRIDVDALEKLVDWHLRKGTSALVIAGTTGESATLSGDEFDLVVSTAVARAGGRIPVIAGTGGPDTAKTVRQTSRAAALGADAALVVTPYYNRPPQAGLLAHYRAVADSASLPLILYNVPSRTGVDLLPDTVAELAQTDSIVAIKEASTEPGRITELIRKTGDRITVLSGDDPSCLQAIFAGARGVISVAANIAPAEMAALCRLAMNGDADEARSLDTRLQPVFAALALQTNPIPVKWAMSQLGLVKKGIRLPLTTLATEFRLKLTAALTAAELNIE